jgi:hypothetical protein
MEPGERIFVLIDLASADPIKLPTGWIVRRLGPQRVWPINPTRIVIELERKWAKCQSTTLDDSQ